MNISGREREEIRTKGEKRGKEKKKGKEKVGEGGVRFNQYISI
jgi:hypothetical protein